MDHIKLASGDNSTLPISPRYKNDLKVTIDKMPDNINVTGESIEQKSPLTENINLQKIEDNEAKLKDRIAQCKSIITSLKFELNEEKAKLEKEVKSQPSYSPKTSEAVPNFPSFYEVSTSDDLSGDLTYNSNMYSACVDNKLNCDENLMEYEKQLEKYQNTLNMAQIEKKNAIRKQMLAKAYRLKLLEVENQCNIELLRVKQSLQCLEPLQMIASKWKNDPDDASYNLDKFELMPRFPELSASTTVDVESFKEESVDVGDDSAKLDSTFDS